MAVIVFRPPAAFLLSVLFSGVFAKSVFKIPGRGLIAPVVVVITLCTLKEGFSALLLSWLSVSVRSPTGGIAEQLLVPLLLDALLFAAVRIVRRHWPCQLNGLIPPYLHMLLREKLGAADRKMNAVHEPRAAV